MIGIGHILAEAEMEKEALGLTGRVAIAGGSGALLGALYGYQWSKDKAYVDHANYPGENRWRSKDSLIGFRGVYEKRLAQLQQGA